MRDEWKRGISCGCCRTGLGVVSESRVDSLADRQRRLKSVAKPGGNQRPAFLQNSTRRDLVEVVQALDFHFPDRAIARGVHASALTSWWRVLWESQVALMMMSSSCVTSSSSATWRSTSGLFQKRSGNRKRKKWLNPTPMLNHHEHRQKTKS